MTENQTKTTTKTPLREMIETAGLVLIVFLVITLSFEPRPVSGVSMQPNLHDSQRVYLNKLAYIFGPPQRGDVVILHPPPTESKDEVFIKRVIGLPGDTLQITPTQIIVNGHQLREAYISLPDNCTPISGIPDGCETRTITLGADQYFTLGDNRPNSSDSRVWGTITREAIIGKAEWVIWPLSEVHTIDTERDTYKGIPTSKLAQVGGFPIPLAIVLVIVGLLAVAGVILWRRPDLRARVIAQLPPALRPAREPSGQ